MASSLPGVRFLLVFVGGVAGSLARWSLTQLLPARDGLPVATLVANLAGAFCLGLLLEALTRSGTGTGSRRRLRLLFGTGFLGAFTTYSALVVETVTLLDQGRGSLALGYLAGSVLAGVVCAWAGLLLGARLARVDER